MIDSMADWVNDVGNPQVRASEGKGEQMQLLGMAVHLMYVSDTRATAGRGVDERSPPVSSAMSALSPSL